MQKVYGSVLLAFLLFSPLFSYAAVSYAGSAVSGSDATEYTFSSLTWGCAASSDRYIILPYFGRESTTNTISSITIGGEAATIVFDGESNSFNTGIAVANVPTGSSGSVVLTFSSGQINAGISYYCSDSGVPTLFDTLQNYNSGVNPTVSGTIDFAADGFAVGISHTGDPNVFTSDTWTGLTEDFSSNVESNVRGTGASSETTASSGNTVQLNYNLSGNTGAANLVAGSFYFVASGGGTTTSTTTSTTVEFPLTRSELLFIIGVLFFFVAYPFMYRLFGSSGRYD